ncbi:MAG: 3-phosphoshikimate 1-carboxyvinyltransferase [Anaerolineae bacterium]
MSQAKDCFRVHPGTALNGTTTVPGDKSLSHRAVMFGALAKGSSRIKAWLPAGDTEASLKTIQALGVRVERHSPQELTIHGGEFHKPEKALDLVNAGTGIRLMAGIMVGQPFESVLDGSEQLRRRPMNRIIQPLRLMGAEIESANGYSPLFIKPAALRGIGYTMPMASAQVKSAILLAALFAQGETIVTQPGPARDHTERMLAAMGADLKVDGDRVIVNPGKSLQAMDFTVPADISSAAFPLVAALIIPGSNVTLTNINLNPTRTGLLDVLKEMGADLTVTETGLEAGEPVGTIRAKHSALKAVRVGGDLVVRMIDEFPIFMVAALFAEGETYVKDAGELRVKETDRIAVMVGELSKMGAKITETEDGFYLFGPQKLNGARVEGHDDHRISMSLAVASLGAMGDSTVMDARCAGDSFPGFAEVMRGLGSSITVEVIA